jgi:aryl-alcohol dehydrogenase-like predicted oxidoreductase
MEQRQLGHHGLTVSAVGMGGVVVSGGYGPVTPEQYTAAVHRALDLGITLFDTAEYYGGDAGETVLGQALHGQRDHVAIATKFGMRRDQTGGPFVDASPSYIARACDASLARLGTDRIDLYQLARVDPSVPVEESVGAMAALVDAGKVRHLGLCEVGPTTLVRAQATATIATVQTEYSLLERHVEESVRPTARRLGVGFIAYCPLSRGLLAGNFPAPEDLAPNDWRRLMERFQGEHLVHNRHLTAALGEVASARGATMAQVALAWLLAQGDDVVPIPGTASLDHVEDNAAAVSVVLSADDVSALDAAFPRGAAEGLRYPESLMAGLDRG